MNPRLDLNSALPNYKDYSFLKAAMVNHYEEFTRQTMLAEKKKGGILQL